MGWPYGFLHDGAGHIPVEPDADFRRVAPEEQRTILRQPAGSAAPVVAASYIRLCATAFVISVRSRRYRPRPCFAAEPVADRSCPHRGTWSRANRLVQWRGVAIRRNGPDGSMRRLAEREIARGSGGRVRRPAGSTEVDIAYLRPAPSGGIPLVVIPHELAGSDGVDCECGDKVVGAADLLVVRDGPVLAGVGAARHLAGGFQALELPGVGGEKRGRGLVADFGGFVIRRGGLTLMKFIDRYRGPSTNAGCARNTCASSCASVHASC